MFPARRRRKACIFHGHLRTLEIGKTPFVLTLKTLDGAVVYQDLKERAFEEDHLGRLSHYSKIDPVTTIFTALAKRRAI